MVVPLVTHDDPLVTVRICILFYILPTVFALVVFAVIIAVVVVICVAVVVPSVVVDVIAPVSVVLVSAAAVTVVFDFVVNVVPVVFVYEKQSRRCML